MIDGEDANGGETNESNDEVDYEIDLDAEHERDC